MLELTRLAGLLAVCLFVLAGAARAADPETGTVEGHVALNGKPVEAQLKEDGSYQANDVPVGAAQVTIEGEGVPAKYADPKTTPIKFDVQKGTSTGDLDLKK